MAGTLGGLKTRGARRVQLKEADTSREIPVRNSPNFRSPNPGLFLHWPLGGILPKVSPSPSGATQGVTGDRSPHRATHPARPSPLLPEGGAAGGAAHPVLPALAPPRKPGQRTGRLELPGQDEPRSMRTGRTVLPTLAPRP